MVARDASGGPDFVTWTYNPASGLAKDTVRLLIGDTVVTDPQMQDEELAVFIAARGTLYGAAADACRSLAAKYSRSVTQSGGGSASAAFSDLSKAYTRMAVTLDAKGVGLAAMPYAGGISIADKQLDLDDDDRVPPRFRSGLDDNSVVPGSTSGPGDAG